MTAPVPVALVGAGAQPEYHDKGRHSQYELAIMQGAGFPLHLGKLGLAA